MSYDHQTLEKKYRQLWHEHRVYELPTGELRRPYYNLMMFPYPSAEGLHVGNMYAFTGADCHGRFRRMQGYDVFEPIGLDGFGIWKGIIGCLGFELKLITPLTWKTEWPDDLLKKLDKPDILKLKPIEVNRLSATDRKKHKDAKKQHKQDMDKAKKLAKDKARELAGKLYPELKECFELKKDDGKAESLLIAEYIRRHANG
jgi:hypothetical protein